jgi:hypothetical protein
MVLGAAIQSRRKNTGYGRLPDSAVAAEDVPVGRPSLLDPILQRASHMLLSDDFGEFLGTVFARENGITHEPKTRL